MDDITSTYNARNVLIEMLEDRNYSVQEEYKQIDMETFRYLYNNKNCDIFVENHLNGQYKAYIKFIYVNKIKPNTVREYISSIKENYLMSDDDCLIIVLKSKPNNSILKISKEKNNKNVEIQWISKLQFNITKHQLVPKHEKITDEEVTKLMEKYKLTSVFQLPIITKEDPIIKYYNFKQGSVCKITRPSQTAADHIYYRCVK